MGTVLNFAAARRPISRRLLPAIRSGGGSGQVIIFPGVRIERDTLDLGVRIGTIGRTAGQKVSDRE
ncbi:hypothetical protein [Polymorphum gilvum]|uniref:Uncharacterized protein n=1 Tax=Polymorphum gilvum (strain LMG 25793 / CGMCC 1.9160 / SL003B-26A1) TaxID=991905 RepID=F2IV36_POLGS|nr:hypothetical protein [Polymorphum gilvum]ADZ71367.1 hypothetical protein SL003B_2944 [Polymorphum gilvum SL003B-26A1]